MGVKNWMHGQIIQDFSQAQAQQQSNSNMQGQLNTTSGSAITALTGDVSATGPGSVAATSGTFLINNQQQNSYYLQGGASQMNAYNNSIYFQPLNIVSDEEMKFVEELRKTKLMKLAKL